MTAPTLTPANSRSFVADVIHLLSPPLRTALASDAALDRSLALAAGLPPILQGGFECRLAPAHDQVDIQQCVYPASEGAAALTAFLDAACAQTGADSPLARLADLNSAWQQPGSLLARSLSELWLEYDADAATPSPIPSIFVGLRYPSLARGEAQRALEQVLSLLHRTPTVAQRAALVRCFDACPDGGAVSHLGIMLGRDGDAVRINVKRLGPAQILAYLNAVGWPGVLSAVAEQLEWLAPLVDRFTLCLDVADSVLPGIGLECACVTPPDLSDRWANLFAALEARDLCSAAQREALLGWPGQTTPINCDDPWPAPLVASSRRRPIHHFSLFERSLSHIKVSLRPQGSPSTKAYLWFQHRWRILAAPTAPATPQPVDDPRPYRQRVQDYYDATTEIYLAHVGRTFQGWTVATAEVIDAAASNRFLAARAGIRPGQRILDAGCGVCGPAIDIAGAIPDLSIDGVTISPVQTAYARRLIEEAGLSARISVQTADYHSLDAPAAHYDAVLFLESSGNTEDRLGLLREMARLLRPGGILYVKDAFVREGALSPAERRSLAEFDRIFLYRTPTFSQMTAALTAAGFVDIHCRDLTGLVSGERWRQATLEQQGGQWTPSPLTLAHRANFEVWPVFCGEVRAQKPVP